MHKSIFLLAIVSLFLSSCSTLNSMYIDQLTPSDVSYPSEINKVGIVNNTDPNIVYMDNSKADQKFLSTKIIIPDGKQWSGNLSNSLADIDYFDEVVLCDTTINHTASEHLLSGTEARQLMQDLDVDMLVTLDQSVGIFRYNANQTLPYSYLSGQAILYSIVRLYLPDRERPYHTFVDKDTLVWENDLGLNDESLKDDITGYISSLPLKHLVPQWKKTERYYYSGRDVNQRDAAIFVRENNWKSAINLWKQSYDTLKNGKGKYEAAFNMALGSEMSGNLDEALLWIGRAEQIGDTSHNTLLKYYKTILENRARDIALTKAQMSRFEKKN